MTGNCSASWRVLDNSLRVVFAKRGNSPLPLFQANCAHQVFPTCGVRVRSVVCGVRGVVCGVRGVRLWGVEFGLRGVDCGVPGVDCGV